MSSPQFEQVTVQTGRRRGWVLPTILAAPLVEVVLWIMVGRWIGFGWALGITLATSVLGLVLLRTAMPRAWLRLRRAAQRPSMAHGVQGVQNTVLQDAPRLVGDAVMSTIGSILLILPGFVTDLLGLVLVTPGVRAPLRKAAIGLGSARIFGIRTRMQRATGTDPLRDPNVVPGQVVDPSDPGRQDRGEQTRPPRQLRTRDDRDDGPLEGTVL